MQELYQNYVEGYADWDVSKVRKMKFLMNLK